MTRDEYRQLCERLAREAIRHAAKVIADEEPSDDLDGQVEHWVDVFLDEHLPDLDPAVVLAATAHPRAFEESAGHPAPDPEIAAIHALQADVWDAINAMEETATPTDERTVARGMIARYRSPEIAMEMAHWHSMDHAEGTAGRARWQRVRRAIAQFMAARAQMIARLSKEGVSK